MWLLAARDAAAPTAEHVPCCDRLEATGLQRLTAEQQGSGLPAGTLCIGPRQCSMLNPASAMLPAPPVPQTRLQVLRCPRLICQHRPLCCVLVEPTVCAPNASVSARIRCPVARVPDEPLFVLVTCIGHEGM